MGLLDTLGLPDARLVPIAGGDINQAFRVEHADGRLFVKTHRAPPPGMFEAEARSLAALSAAVEARVVCVPDVVSVGPDHLALEWIGDRPGPSASGAPRALGIGLARIHRQTAPTWGWDEDNWIGTLPQFNPLLPGSDGPAAFFAAARIRAQVAMAGPGTLPTGCPDRLERLCDRLRGLLPDERPALLHGDLWGGNWTTDGRGRPWIYDPASYYGCREADLAFTRLFGGFPPAFYTAYEGEFPLAAGFKERVDLWNLYPLLVHANLFGGGYGRQVDTIARRYL
jgi:protein-ribulosamine 3-kinase